MNGKVQTLLTVNDKGLAEASQGCVFYEVREGRLQEG